jgi:cbb3-type cytochrome oxidase subunit 3
MKSEVLSQFPYIWLTIIGFFLFLGVFVGMFIWIYRRDSKKFYDNCANLVLDGEKQ